MKDIEYYRGREQTYLKHFFLERYLERVAYIIGYSHPRFVYVDGFSGPWKSTDDAFEDTSFKIAINKLRNVRTGLERVGKHPDIRCLFIEKDPTAFAALKAAMDNVSGIDVKVLPGEFEKLIPDILKFVGRSFVLVFIDPTGWTGFGLRKVQPILKHQPGEVIVNFMFDHINRFLDHPAAKVATSFDSLFGGPGWNAAVRSGDRRENEIVELYRERLRAAGSFAHVTHTRVLKPISDRSYFYLVYGTRNVKGLLEFRRVEKEAIEEQERIRLTAKQTERVERSGQFELFAVNEAITQASYERERAAQLEAAAERLRKRLRADVRVRYDDALAVLLEHPYVWKADVGDLIKQLHLNGELKVEGLVPRERTIKSGHVLVWRGRGDGQRSDATPWKTRSRID